jgi:Mg2+ and Co2+ transporter CorA
MRIFEIPDCFYTIREAIERGEEPSVEVVNLLLKEGPKSIDDYFMMIEEVEGEAEIIKQHIEVMKARMERRKTTVEKMKSYMQQILTAEFKGKVRTSLATYWVQGGTTYDFGTSFEEHPELFKIPDPVLKKAELIALFKAGTMPDDICVTETETSSLRVRR